ncbi:Chromate resistance protein ChrB [Actinoallomurus sp. NPDC050550]|uniref:Chromate resistance protein ChrB n=1 Tax=Actinoallomurus sp. NPDC050550 TaxID=3154937 RepID=UPI0033EC3566
MTARPRRGPGSTCGIRSRDRATYTEVEESEVDLQRFEKWLAAIIARDYFDAPGGAAARAAVEECKAAFARFEQLAFHADTTPTKAE